MASLDAVGGEVLSKLLPQNVMSSCPVTVEKEVGYGHEEVEEEKDVEVTSPVGACISPHWLGASRRT